MRTGGKEIPEAFGVGQESSNPSSTPFHLYCEEVEQRSGRGTKRYRRTRGNRRRGIRRRRRKRTRRRTRKRRTRRKKEEEGEEEEDEEKGGSLGGGGPRRRLRCRFKTYE